MLDVLIVGGGPAGLSCGLVLGRCRRRVLVVDAEEPRNARVAEVSGFLTRDGISPAELRRLGRAELERYGVEWRHGRVAGGAASPEGWGVEVDDTRVEARKLVLATGIRDHLPPIPGVAPFWGRSVVVCPYCDGWEHAGEPLAVYGWDLDAADAAVGLLTWSDRVALCTDGRPPPAEPRLERHGVAVAAGQILCLEGEGDLERVRFLDGSALSCSTMFVHAGQRPSDALGAAFGCELDANGMIRVDATGRTGVPALWACGDAATGTQLAVVAAAEGARVAISVNRELRREERP